MSKERVDKVTTVHAIYQTRDRNDKPHWDRMRELSNRGHCNSKFNQMITEEINKEKVDGKNS